MFRTDARHADRPGFQAEHVHQHHGVLEFEGPDVHESMDDFRQVLKTYDARPLPPVAQIGGAPARGDGVAVERAYRSAYYQVGLEARGERTPRSRLPGAEHSAARENQIGRASCRERG